MADRQTLIDYCTAAAMLNSASIAQMTGQVFEPGHLLVCGGCLENFQHVVTSLWPMILDIATPAPDNVIQLKLKGRH